MKKECGSPTGKCMKPATCKKLGRCVMAKKPGQVTGKGGGYAKR